MKKVFVLAFVLGITMTCCGQNAAQSDSGAFDITKYLNQIKENDELRYVFTSDELAPKEYALVDIDGDGKSELMVRDTEIHYQAVYTIEGDSLWMLAYADGCTDLEFYKNGVGYQAYYSPGRAYDGIGTLQNSRHGDRYMHEVKFDIAGDQDEVEYETFFINSEMVTAEDIEAFKKKMGEPVEAPAAEWLPIDGAAKATPGDAKADEDTMDEVSFPLKYINEKVAEADEREGEPYSRYVWLETVTTEESA